MDSNSDSDVSMEVDVSESSIEDVSEPEWSTNDENMDVSNTSSENSAELGPAANNHVNNMYPRPETQGSSGSESGSVSEEDRADETSDGSSNNGDDHEHFFTFDPEEYNMDEPLLTNWRACDVFLALLCKSIKYNEKYESFIETMKILGDMFDTTAFPKNTPALWRRLRRNRKHVKYTVYCCACGDLIGDGKKPTKRCTCGKSGPGKKKQPLGRFVHLGIRAQLIELLKRPNMEKNLNYRNTRAKWNDADVKDIFDGVMYLNLLRTFLSNPNNYSLTIWLDGVKISKSSKTSATPILLMLNELSPHSRKRHILLGGVWVGSKKPNLSKILKPIVEELRSLYTEGINWRPFEGGPTRVSKFVTCVLSCDSEARYDVLCMKRHNSPGGCTFCDAQGVADKDTAAKRNYPANEAYQLRTHQGILAEMMRAQQGNPPSNGVKKLSPLAALKDFDLASGVIVESFHAIYEGAAKKISTIFLQKPNENKKGQKTNRNRLRRVAGAETTEPSNEPTTSSGNGVQENLRKEKNPWYVGEPDKVARINQRLREILTPSRISRCPRMIEDMPNWKGSEWRNWIIYYAPVVLSGILKPKYHRLLVKLSEATFLLNQHSISEEDMSKAERLLEEFNQEFEQFGEKKMVYNIHLLLHVIIGVRNWGPLWVLSGAIFEAWNKKLVDSITSSNDRCSQIIDRFLLFKFLEDVSLDENISPAARNRMREYLQGARWDIAPEVATGRYFRRETFFETSSATDEEKELIRDSGVEIGDNVELTRFKSAKIHGARFKVRKFGNFIL